MAKKRPTPEEQLLNLIEKEEGPKTLRPKRRRTSWFSFISLDRLWLLWPTLKRTLSTQLAKLKANIKEPNIKVINKGLIVASVVLIGYLIADFTFRRLDIKGIYKRSSVLRKRKFKQPSIKEAHPFLYYLEMVRRRNIFSPVVLKSVEESQDETKKILTALVKNLKLVGISWGKEPEAMIEDQKVKRTYFLKTGDMINNLKIDTILRNRVVLTYEGLQAELM